MPRLRGRGTVVRTLRGGLLRLPGEDRRVADDAQRGPAVPVPVRRMTAARARANLRGRAHGGGRLRGGRWRGHPGIVRTRGPEHHAGAGPMFATRNAPLYPGPPPKSTTRSCPPADTLAAPGSILYSPKSPGRTVVSMSEGIPEPVENQPWRQEDGPPPRVWCWPSSHRPALEVWSHGRWRYAPVFPVK